MSLTVVGEIMGVLISSVVWSYFWDVLWNRSNSTYFYGEPTEIASIYARVFGEDHLSVTNNIFSMGVWGVIGCVIIYKELL